MKSNWWVMTSTFFNETKYHRTENIRVYFTLFSKGWDVFVSYVCVCIHIFIYWLSR